MKIPVILTGLLWTLFAASPALFAQTPAHDLDIAGMDRSVSPCRDFYQFANGGWLTANPIPADRARWGAFDVLSERNLAVEHQICEEAASVKDAKPGSATQKIGDFYRAGMDEAKINAQGAAPLIPEFAAINAISDTPSLLQEIAHLHQSGIRAAFGFGVGQDAKESARQRAQLRQGGTGLPDRDYYLSDDPRQKGIRDAYAQHLSRLFALLGDSNPDAEAATVLTVETRLAKASMDRVSLRDPNASYHKMNLQGLNELTPGVQWNPYFAAVGVSEPGDMIVGQPAFFTELGRMTADVPLADWKTYLRGTVIRTEASLLSKPFEDEDFAFTGRVLSGVQVPQPRWKRITRATDGALGELVGQVYVARAFSPDAKKRALTLVNNLKAALRERLTTLEWMSPATRTQAIEKLNRITVKIGYPNKWRDYSALQIGDDSYVGNTQRVSRFEFQRNLKKLGKPVDTAEWGMTPPTVNAYYSPSRNEIVFPAGILQPPFFDAQADDAVNYGGIGAVIGHEMTHGFDDQGRQFDALGNLRDWWTPADAKNFQARAALVAAQFDAFSPVEGVHVNGKLTLGEDIADLGGLKIAYLAFEKAMQGKPRPLIDGFTPEQRFFLAFAQIWRSNARPETLRLRVATDPHAPDRFRVIGPLSNLPEFAQAFPCPDAKPEHTQVTIW